MRKFIAGCCCVIVGLEVLVGVPLAVCLAVLVFGQGAIGPMVVETQTVGPVQAWDAPRVSALPASLPPSPYDPVPTTSPSPIEKPIAAGNANCKLSPTDDSIPLAFAPSSLPPPAYDPYIHQPPRAALCPSPAAVSASVAEAEPASADAETQGPALAGGVARASGQVSDDLDTARAAAPPAELPPAADNGPAPAEPAETVGKTGPELIADWQHLLAAAAQHFAARASCDGQCEAPADANTPAGDGAEGEHDLLASLDSAARQLYAAATRSEAEYDYDQADALRQLARDLRRQSIAIQQRRHREEHGRGLRTE